jgi:hypothetical protein
MKTALWAAFSAVFAFFCLILGLAAFSAGGLIGHGIGLVFLTPAFVLIFLWLKVAWRRLRNSGDGVVAAWGRPA